MKLNFGLQPYWEELERLYNFKYSKELDKITKNNIINKEYLISFINSCFSQDIKISITFFTSENIPSTTTINRMLKITESKNSDILYISEGKYKKDHNEKPVKYIWSINNKYSDKKIAKIFNRFNKLAAFI